MDATASGCLSAGDVFDAVPSTGGSPAAYFGPAYFGGRSFGRAYFGGYGSPPPVDVPDGIRRRFLETVGTAWVVGGMTEGLVPDDVASDLYISFHDITTTATYVAGHPAYAVDLVYQFDCYAPTRYDARRMADLLERIFHPLAPRIATEAGLVFGMHAMPGGGMDDAGIASRSGLPLYKFTRDFSFSVSRTRPTP